jgi:NAD(P)H-hydrate epimerase
MKELERKAAESGLSYYQMMENAGTAAYNYIKRSAKSSKNIAIFCGKGNNGGDGFVVARKFKQAGADVSIILVDGQPKTQDAQKNMQLCSTLDIPILDITNIEVRKADFIKDTSLIVDAIYGTGFHGELNQSAQLAAQWINQADVPVYAMDIPSGLNGDSGQAAEGAVRADYTIAFHRYKPVHFADEAKPYCGKLACVDIGIMF